MFSFLKLIPITLYLVQCIGYYIIPIIDIEIFIIPITLARCGGISMVANNCPRRLLKSTQADQTISYFA